MSYVKDNLMPNEKILYTARVHPAVFLPSVFMFVMTIALFIYGLSNAAVSKAGTPPPQATAGNLIGSMLIIISGFLFLYSI